MAISHSYRILSWQESLTEDEIPPQWMWHIEEELELWFEMIQEKRKEKYGVADGSGEIEGPTMDNSYADELRKS